MSEIKYTAEEIYEIEEQDDLIRLLYDCMGNVSSDVRNAIRNRVIYFFGLNV